MECAKCGVTMMDAQFCTGAYGSPPYLMRKRKGTFESEHRCGVDCLVCPVCGKVEFYAQEVRKLLLS